MTKHIPYILATLTVVAAVVLAFMSDTFSAGTLLIVSGVLYLVFQKSILQSTHEVEEKKPSLSFISKIVGGTTEKSMKISGISLVLVGFFWLFLV
jgi:putative Ca2+/H+ antiporter (TMEM165/GDT1 family)